MESKKFFKFSWMFLVISIAIWILFSLLIVSGSLSISSIAVWFIAGCICFILLILSLIFAIISLVKKLEKKYLPWAIIVLVIDALIIITLIISFLVELIR